MSALLKLVLGIEPQWGLQERQLKELTDFAVAVRYPGTFTDARAAKEAFATCGHFRDLARLSLGLHR